MLVIADEDLAGVDASALAQADAVIVIGTTIPAAATHIAAALPVCNVAEEEGTFTNLRGRVQRFLQAKAAPGLARPSWYALADLLVAVGDTVDYSSAANVFEALARAESAFSGLSYETLALKGAVVSGGAPAPAGTAA